MKIRFIMLGGFLGAGKTTTIGRLANHYQSQGLRVGIVTNDQASDLVDTHLLRSQGFAVGEVAGACFCCNFNELTDVAEKLGRQHQPDIVLAEPVGSCTDLVATVIQPLKQLFDANFEVAPYGVLLKPSHGLRILRNEPNAGFSPKAAYIFLKQLEEADFIVLNRIDQILPAEADELERLLRQQFPNSPVLRMSARTGAGFAAVTEMLDQRGAFGRRVLELDYDVYAAGEAELGWLNTSFRLASIQSFSLDEVLLQLILEIEKRLAEIPAETAHLKAIGLVDGAHGVANLISSTDPPELSLASECRTASADLIINARVALDPEQLEQTVHQAIEIVGQQHAADVKNRQTQCFRPGRPVPTHRLGLN